MFAEFNGATFDAGLYRLHTVEEVSAWSSIATAAFPQFSDRIECFASDWLGRVFALDRKRAVAGEPGVMILEPGTGQTLEVPANFLSFHCEELIRHADAALALDAYREWRRHDTLPLERTVCIGYKIPLFLGGDDTVENMERIDMEVYWETCAQLIRQVQNLPEGTSIKEISLSRKTPE